MEHIFYKRRMRLQDMREMTSLIRTGAQTWHTLLIQIGAGRRPPPQGKRSTKLQEKDETTRHARDDKPNSDKNRDMTTSHARDDKPNLDKNTDMEHTAFGKWSWPKLACLGVSCFSCSLVFLTPCTGQLHKTREAPDYKRSMRLPDTRETTSPIRTPTQTWNTLLF